MLPVPKCSTPYVAAAGGTSLGHRPKGREAISTLAVRILRGIAQLWHDDGHCRWLPCQSGLSPLWLLPEPPARARRTPVAAQGRPNVGGGTAPSGGGNRSYRKPGCAHPSAARRILGGGLPLAGSERTPRCAAECPPLSPVES